MIMWLDHLLFGNGRGLASPFCNQRFYWLGGEKGEMYHWQPCHADVLLEIANS